VRLVCTPKSWAMSSGEDEAYRKYQMIVTFVCVCVCVRVCVCVCACVFVRTSVPACVT